MFIHLFIKDQKEMKRRNFGFRFIETIISIRVVDSAILHLETRYTIFGAI